MAHKVKRPIPIKINFRKELGNDLDRKYVSVENLGTFSMKEGILIDYFEKFTYDAILNANIISFTVTKEMLQRAVDLKDMEKGCKRSLIN